jgi:hypothetical protein
VILVSDKTRQPSQGGDDKSSVDGRTSITSKKFDTFGKSKSSLVKESTQIKSVKSSNNKKYKGSF